MKRHIIALGIITVLCFAFNWRLFFPSLQIVATPEFELHDAIQLSYASKWWYAQKIHNLELPIWSSRIGGGFPMLGEGQTGIFFVPNIVLFGIIPNPDLAYNLVLTLVPIMMSYGMYVWLTMMGISWGLSILGGLTLGLSGFTLFHLQHLALLQGFSLIPLLIASSLGMTRNKSKPWIFLFILTLSQQVCTGFVQAVVIGGLFSFSYFIFLVHKKPDLWKRIFIYILAVIGAVGVSAIQFLPSLEFLNQISSWERNNPDWPTQYSFPFRFLLTFLHPFLIGNPATGMYKGSSDPGSIYWENIAYVGILPIILTLYAVISKQIRKNILFFFMTLFGSFLLMLGKFSPLYFVFNFFPLNLFRVPSRFIYLFALCLTVIAIKTSTILTHHKPMYVRVIVLALWAMNLLFLYPLWTSYHGLKSPSQIHEAPLITSIIPENAYILRFYINNSQRTRYFTYGWTDMKHYDFYKNTLMPNTNEFWNYTISDAYPSRFLKRPALLDGFFLASVNEDEKNATMGATTRTFLSLTPTDFILSGKPIDSDGEYILTHTLTDDDASIYIYEIPKKTPRAFFPTSWRVFSTLSDMEKILDEPNFSPQNSVLLEKNISLPPYPSDTHNPQFFIHKQTDTNIRIHVTDVTQDSLFTMALTYYPGWTATVDGKKTEIFPVNIRNMGIVVPKETSSIEFHYMPKSLMWGAIISVISIVLTIVLVLSLV